MTGTWVIDLATIATTFLLIFPAELPDKTFIATLVLSTRYPRLPVWLGVISAFAVQCFVAVAAGGLLSLLPGKLVLAVTFVLFAVGAFILLRTGLRARAEEMEGEDEEEREVLEKAESAHPTSTWKVFATSFVVLFTAEWGDLSQLLGAGLAARTGQPLSVFIGSWTALATVSGIAVLVGGWLRERVPLWRVRLISGSLLALLAAWTLVELIRS